MDLKKLEIIVESRIAALSNAGNFAFTCNRELAKTRIIKDIMYKFSDTNLPEISLVDFYIEYATRKLKNIENPKEREKIIIENIMDLELESSENMMSRIKKSIENETLVVRMLLPSYIEISVKKGMSNKEKIKEVNKIISEMSDESILMSLSSFNNNDRSLNDILKENSFFDEDILEVAAIYEKEEWDKGVMLPKSKMYTDLWELYSEGKLDSIEQKLEVLKQLK